MSDEKKKSIGGIWKKQSKNGMDYMSGQIEVNGEKVNFTVFENGFKEKDSHPDYKIFLSEMKQQDAKPAAKPTGKAPAAKAPVAKKPSKPVQEEDDDSEDVPF